MSTFASKRVSKTSRSSSSSIRPWKMSRSSCTCTSSPQSVGGPRAGETGGGSSGSPRCVRIFRMGPGSVMKAISRMSPAHAGHSSGNSPHPRHQFRPRNPRGVVRAGLCLSVATAFCGMRAAPIPASRGVASLADVPDRQSRDGGPELVIRGEHPVIARRQAAMPATSRAGGTYRRPRVDVTPLGRPAPAESG